MIDQKTHPVREALVALLRERGTLTSAEAARELGGNSGSYSFHLRQLARYGVIEEVPAEGRAKPWRLVGPEPPASPSAATPSPTLQSDRAAATVQSELNRGLEDESYRQWLTLRNWVPEPWRDRDQAFSEIVYLTPEELTELGNAVRALIAGYSGRPAHNRGPVAAVARFFPLLTPEE